MANISTVSVTSIRLPLRKMCRSTSMGLYMYPKQRCRPIRWKQKVRGALSLLRFLKLRRTLIELSKVKERTGHESG